MAQAPATPKLRRARNLIGARLFGRAIGPLAASEKAALALRKARQGEQWAAPREVIFLIPLVGPDAVGDWGRVTALLTRTLASFQRQTHASWRAVICCQEPPPLPDDTRITYMPFTEQVDGNDKWAKLARLYHHLPETARGAGLAMTFDGDDLAAPDLVAALLDRPNGTLVTHGIVFDASEKRLALARPQSLLQPGAKAFWKLCGSCAALPFDVDQASAMAQFDLLRETSRHEHRMVPYLCALAGHRLSPLRRPLALYMLNHGENFGARRGRVSFKTRFVQRFQIEDPAALEKLFDDFDLWSDLRG